MSRYLSSAFLVILLTVSGCAPRSEFVPLFNGRDLSGWKNINGAESTWNVRDGMIVCSGFPTGVMCTTRQYENFVLELEWRHLTEGGNAGLFLHSDPLPARGQPFTRSIEAQVLDGNHGDVFAIHGATMVPDRPHPKGWMRSLPIEERANPTGEWNHYRVESRDGNLTLAVNGKVVSGGSELSPRKGYICLESEGAEAHFRNIRINELPSTQPAPDETADVYQGFASLYNGVDLEGWRSRDGWRSDDWILRGESGAGDHLWTEAEYGDFTLIADWRCDGENRLGGILLRGSPEAQVQLSCEAATASSTAWLTVEPQEDDDPSGRGWHRLTMTARGDQLSVELNGRKVADRRIPGGVPARGPIGLANHGTSAEFANVFIKELD